MCLCDLPLTVVVGGSCAVLCVVIGPALPLTQLRRPLSTLQHQPSVEYSTDSGLA